MHGLNGEDWKYAGFTILDSKFDFIPASEKMIEFS